MSPTFKKPHYEAIVEALNEAREENPLDLLDISVLVEALANLFERDDPRFDRKRFARALAYASLYDAVIWQPFLK
jgi:hypothetical protein